MIYFYNLSFPFLFCFNISPPRIVVALRPDYFQISHRNSFRFRYRIEPWRISLPCFFSVPSIKNESLPIMLSFPPLFPIINIGSVAMLAFFHLLFLRIPQCVFTPDSFSSPIKFAYLTLQIRQVPVVGDIHININFAVTLKDPHVGSGQESLVRAGK